MISLNKIKIVPTKFPDGTIQVWKLDEKNTLLARDPATIEWEYENDGEIIILAQLKLLLDASGVPSNLVIPYLPYGRQDKFISNISTFGLYAFALLINSLKFDSVTCFDVHSDVAERLIDGFIWEKPDINHIINQHDIDYVIYPDRGALSKYVKFMHYPFKYADKVRNQLTGEITKLEFHGDIKECNLLIVDDLCDGGATFTALARELKERGADEVNLYVSHGIFSKGTQILRDAGITHIWTRKGLVQQ